MLERSDPALKIFLIWIIIRFSNYLVFTHFRVNGFQNCYHKFNFQLKNNLPTRVSYKVTLFWAIWCVYSIPELICVICIVFSGLGFLYCYTWVIFWFGFIRYHSKYFYILLYVCMLTTMNHCKHWHKSTSYITFF
jgi:hypothetical protein